MRTQRLSLILSCQLLAFAVLSLASMPAPPPGDSVKQAAEINDPEGGSDDQFGYSVAIDGDAVVVGAPQFSGGTGVAYLFLNSGGLWKEAAELTSGDPETIEFGTSVAVGKNVIAVGAPFDGDGNGVAYIFVEPPDGWAGTLTPTASLTTPFFISDAYLGSSLAMSPDGAMAVAGAPGWKGDLGSADVFVEPTGGWADMSSPTAILTSSSSHEVGASVAVSGEAIVVGETNSLIPPQAAFVFVEPKGGWANSNGVPTATLTASDNNLQVDRFAYSVAISDNTIVVGAPYHPNFAPGTAYVYVRPKNGWIDATQTAELSVPVNSNLALGQCAAVGGNIVLAGAPADTIGHNSRQGSVLGYLKPSGGWMNSLSPTGAVTPRDGEAGELFGDSIAVNGKNIVVGAPHYGQALQGVVYIFSLR